MTIPYHFVWQLSRYALSDKPAELWYKEENLVRYLLIIAQALNKLKHVIVLANNNGIFYFCICVLLFINKPDAKYVSEWNCRYYFYRKFIYFGFYVQLVYET